MLSMMNRLNIHNHSGGYDEMPQHPLDRLEPLRKSKRLRQNTFDSWPQDSEISPLDLCNDGFYYMGISDKVQCAYCGGVLSGWQKDDNVHREHAKHFGKCPLFRQSLDVLDGGPSVRDKLDLAPNEEVSPKDLHQGHNFGYNNDLVERSVPENINVHNSKYSLYSTRLESYENWPKNHYLKPDALASAGLHYKGEGDKCQCFMCGGILAEWEPGDVPKDEHNRWFPKCYNSQ